VNMNGIMAEQASGTPAAHDAELTCASASQVKSRKTLNSKTVLIRVPKEFFSIIKEVSNEKNISQIEVERCLARYLLKHKQHYNHIFGLDGSKRLFAYHSITFEDEKKHPELRRLFDKTFIKKTVFKHYSPNREIKCATCGISDLSLLTIDHINNDGYKDRKNNPAFRCGGHTLYRWLIINDYPVGFQILCHNCNWKKGRKWTEERKLAACKQK
jgi:hypothetical protein